MASSSSSSSSSSSTSCSSPFPSNGHSIEEAISGLPPQTQHFLLNLLLNSHIHSPSTDSYPQPPPTDASFVQQPLQQSSPNGSFLGIEFLSPLTSPALGPVHSATPSPSSSLHHLNLSGHSFLPHPNASPIVFATPGDPSGQAFSSPLLVPSPRLAAINSTRHQNLPQQHQRQQHQRQEQQQQQQHNLQQHHSSSRPSPNIRPLDQALDLTQTGHGPSKRAKSITGPGSATFSPEHHPILTCHSSPVNNVLLSDSPSPIDWLSIDLDPQNNSQALQNTSTLLSSSSHHPTQQHIRPLTPACLMNSDPFASSTATTTPAGTFSNKSLQQGLGIHHQQFITLNSLQKELEPKVVDRIEKVLSTGVVTPGQRSGHSSATGDQKSPNRETTLSTSSDITYTKLIEYHQINQKTIASAELSPALKKSSHKVAEQRRRDSLKMCFDDLRQILPTTQSKGGLNQDQDEDQEDQEEEIKRPGEGNVGGQRGVSRFDPLNPNKGISKVALLRRSNQYIIKLKDNLVRKDQIIDSLIKILQQRRVVIDDRFEIDEEIKNRLKHVELAAEEKE